MVDMFLACRRHSEKSGRSTPKIVETCGQQVISFNENSIVVTIPFNWINVVGNKTDVKLTPNRTRMISEIRNNQNITSSQLASVLGISTTAVEKNIRYLKDNGCIERIGSNKSGYWKVKD